MLQKLLNKILKTHGQKDVITPLNSSANFILKYKNLPIGNLILESSVWKFKYSEQFRLQNEIMPLVEFPDTSKEYESIQLLPFFSYRIPGLSQPAVKAIIEKEKIGSKNEVALLKKFARVSVFNPFLLTPSL